MPIDFDGAPFPLRTVLTIAVADLPAAFGFVAATALGKPNENRRRTMRQREDRLAFKGCS
jgi:hypothetical protein